jgi:hypothetical protein
VLCPCCNRNKKVTAYAAYVDFDESCRCEPQEDPMHVIGHPYPPIDYAVMAPPLSVQAAMDREVAVTPPGALGRYGAYVPGQLTNGALLPQNSYATSLSPVLPAPAPSLAAADPYATVAPPRPAAPPKLDAAYAAGLLGLATPVASARARAARDSVAHMGKGHIGESVRHDMQGLISTHLRWASATARPGFQPDPRIPFRVRYLRTADEREPFRVTLGSGRAVYRRAMMDTTGARKVLRIGRGNLETGPMGEITDRFIYVMSTDGIIYAADASGEYKRGGVFDQGEFKVAIGNTHKVAQALGGAAQPARTELLGFHHSSFLEGRDVACAGEIEAVQGKILSINNNSGHYRPPPECLTAVVDVLRRRGVDVERVKVGINRSGGHVHGALHYFEGAAAFAAFLRSR